MWCPRGAIVPVAGQVTNRDRTPSENTEPCCASVSTTQNTHIYTQDAMCMSSQCKLPDVCESVLLSDSLPLDRSHFLSVVACLNVSCFPKTLTFFSYIFCLITKFYYLIFVSFCYFLNHVDFFFILALLFSDFVSFLSVSSIITLLNPPHAHNCTQLQTQTVPGSVSCVTCILLCVLQTDPTSPFTGLQ